MHSFKHVCGSIPCTLCELKIEQKSAIFVCIKVYELLDALLISLYGAYLDVDHYFTHYYSSQDIS